MKKWAQPGGMALFLCGALLAGSATAQIHGVPASATSLGPNGFTPFHGNFPPGIPAGATSLGPNGFAGNRQRFDGEVFLSTTDGRRIRSGRFRSQPFFVPLMYSPFYYDMTAPLEAPQYYSAQSQQSAAAMPSKLEITIVDKRDSGVHPANVDSAPVPPPPATASPATEELAAKVIIMRNGSKKEIRNYAIVGKVLFDLSDGRSRRIPLDDIDAAATTKANEDNGVDFKLP